MGCCKTLTTGKGRGFWKELSGFMEGQDYHVMTEKGTFFAMRVYEQSVQFESDMWLHTFRTAKNRIISLLKKEGPVYISSEKPEVVDGKIKLKNDANSYILKEGEK